MVIGGGWRGLRKGWKEQAIIPRGRPREGEAHGVSRTEECSILDGSLKDDGEEKREKGLMLRRRKSFITP